MSKTYTNIPTLQKLIFTRKINNLEKLKKYTSQGESARIKSIRIKHLNTEPLHPVYYTSKTPKTRVIINNQTQKITILNTDAKINVII